MNRDKEKLRYIIEASTPHEQRAKLNTAMTQPGMSRVARRQAEEQQEAQRKQQGRQPIGVPKNNKAKGQGSKVVNWLLAHKRSIIVLGIILLVCFIGWALMPDTSHQDATNIENAINQQYTDKNKVYLSADADDRSVAKIGDKLSAYKGNDKVSLTNEYNTLKAKVAIQTDVNNLFENNAIEGVSYKQKGISTSTTKDQLNEVKTKVSKLTTDGFKTNANSATADVSSQLSQVASVKHMLSSIKKEVTDLDDQSDNSTTNSNSTTTDAYGNPVADSTTNTDGTSNTSTQEKVAGDLAKAKVSVKGLKSEGYQKQFNTQIEEIEKINNAVAEAEEKAETDLKDSTDTTTADDSDVTDTDSANPTADTDSNDTSDSSTSTKDKSGSDNGTTTSDGKQLFNDEASAISWATQQSATNHKNWHVYSKGGTNKYYVTFD